jgi:tetratricopeptide (TPR) repeat protein
VLKILDFGIARLAESGLTQMSVTVGTPGYMSPEQIDGRHIERASDVFSVGAVAYELMTYRAAFGGDSQHAIIYSVLHSEPEPILTLAPDLPPDVVATIEKALQKSTELRYEDAVSLQSDLQSCREALGGTRRTPLRVTPARMTQRPATGSENPSETPTSLARPTPGNMTPPANLIERAKQAMSEGQSARALELVNRILASDPQQSEALTIQYKIEEPHVDELLSKARAGLLGQRLTEAGDYIARALKMRPGLEAALKLQAELDSHRTDVEKKLGGRARAKAAVERGRKYILQGAWDAARRAADEAWALDPDNGEAADLIAAADAGQSGVGIAPYPGSPMLGPTVPMAVPGPGTVSAPANAAALATAAVPVSAGAVIDRQTGSAGAAPRRGMRIWLLAGAGVIAIGVTAYVMLNGPGKPVAPPTDTVPPVVKINSPINSTAPLSGPIAINVSASDNFGVVGVTIKVDGAPVGTELTSAPYAMMWAGNVGDGRHEITVDARDAAGLHSTDHVSITTSNPAAQAADARGGAQSTRSGGGAAVTPPEDPKVRLARIKEQALREADDLAKKGKDFTGALAKVNKALEEPGLKNDTDLKLAQSDYQDIIKSLPTKGRGRGGQ